MSPEGLIGQNCKMAFRPVYAELLSIQQVVFLTVLPRKAWEDGQTGNNLQFSSKQRALFLNSS
jgi:hypothetical protein